MAENHHVIPVNYTRSGIFITRSVTQIDYGMILDFHGFDLPRTFEVHFENPEKPGRSFLQIGNTIDGVSTVEIPYICLQYSKIITAYLFLHDTEADGQTRFTIRVPVKERAILDDEIPTPPQQSAISQAITALNQAVEETGAAQQAAEDARDIAVTAKGNAVTAKEAAEAAAQNAAESKNAAAESARQAGVSADAAAESARLAGSRKELAESAAGVATEKASAAAESARLAGVSEANASGSANAAAESARLAGISERNASESASTASGKANDAAESARQAGLSETNARNSAGTAAESASVATSKAGEASQSAQTATTKAGEAAQSAAAAAQSATDAANTVSGAVGTINAARDAAVTAVQDKGDEVLDSIPADYTELTEEVSDLNLALNNKADKSDTLKITEPEETEADLYVCDSNGNVLAKFVNGHIKTKNFDSSAIQLDLIMDTDSTTADLYICDSFGNVIAEFVNGHIKTKNFDSGNIDFSGLETAIEEIADDVSVLKSKTTGIVYRTKDQTDGVYATCRYHQPNASSKQFCMLIAGDIHTDLPRMNSIIEYLNAVDAFDCGIMLGDISGNTFDDPIVYYTGAIQLANKPFLTVLGNHDVVGATSDSDLYTKFGDCFQYAQLASGEAVSGKCYYFKDFAAQKIRVIVLMQYDLAGRASDTGDLCFGQDQIDWFIGVLNSTPSDYGVVIAEHTNPSRYMTYNMDVSVTSDTWRRSNYAPTLMDGDPVPDIVNAWIGGTTFLKTYSYTFSNPPTPLSVSADFTNRGTGEFITYLGGHWHMDVLGTPTGYDNQPDYHTPAAGLSAATQGDIPRKAGTLSEDSLCAIAVDREKKTVKVFHVGAHFTKDAVDRLYFKYAYGA